MYLLSPSLVRSHNYTYIGNNAITTPKETGDEAKAELKLEPLPKRLKLVIF